MNNTPGIDKPNKKLSTPIAVISSMAIILTAIAYVIIDYRNTMTELLMMQSDQSILALEPTRSDASSERDNKPGGDDDGSGNNGDGNSNGDPNGNGLGNDGNGGNNGGTGDDNDGDRDNDYGNYPPHGLPCLDPNCPIHHPHNNGGDNNNSGDDGNGGNPDGLGNGSGNGDNDRPPLDITMDLVNFQPNLAVYVNETEAEKVLHQYVASFNHYLTQYPDGKIYLVGCIARTKNNDIIYDGDIALSENRAKTVMNTFIKFGIDKSKLEVIGIGPLDPWREDEWADGYFNEAVAKNNRRVWVIPDQYTDQIAYIKGLNTDIQNEIE